MHTLRVRNVERALFEGLRYIRSHGYLQDSRAGQVLVAPNPVSTVYGNPVERVLLSAWRDANPFFHLFEALWMLAGRNDARFLDRFVSDFSSRFAEDDGIQHGAYGYRWRRHFDIEGGGNPNLPDQLETVIRLLRANPADRRAVIAMWDPAADLGADKRDIPCNDLIFLRVRTDQVREGLPALLDITVCCRSNDIIWGAYGANAVHFSILQEYLAARIGLGVGTYTQVSNNYHAYMSTLDRFPESINPTLEEYYGYSMLRVEPFPLVKFPEEFDSDLANFFAGKDEFVNPFFDKVATPMLKAHSLWKSNAPEAALERLKLMPKNNDWREAAEGWISRRISRRIEKHSGV